MCVFHKAYTYSWYNLTPAYIIKGEQFKNKWRSVSGYNLYQFLGALFSFSLIPHSLTLIIITSCYWPLVRGIHRSPVNSPHKGQWRGALMFSLICVWINGWVNNREAGDLRRYRAHYDVTVMNAGLARLLLKLGHGRMVTSLTNRMLYSDMMTQTINPASRFSLRRI